jgi:shikimate dehydrogenase
MKRLAVLGHPVAHSRSPRMQTAALEALGLDGAWSYEAIDIPPDEFDRQVRAMAGAGFAGANVTIPHKEAALAVATERSNEASEIGAANTLSFDGDQIRADNTDATGLVAALPSSPRGLRALVLGAGGSARAVVWALAREGAMVEVWNRTPERAGELAASLAARGTGEGTIAAVDEEGAFAGGHELIANCTAVGMKGEDPFKELPLDAAALNSARVVVDLVYAGGETELVRRAHAMGAQTVDGIEVLARQGAESLRIWTGKEAPLDVMREAARAG